MVKSTTKKSDIFAVAKAARVSPSTVSRSFNHPDLVKPETRRRIEKAIRKLGYIRNRAAQTMHGIRSGTIGLIVPTVDQAIFAELIQSFSEAIEELGFTILLASHGYSLDREYALARKMLEHRVDGMALIGTEHMAETYDLLVEQATPTLLLWNYAADTPFACVGCDNFEAGRLIGGHVAALGHQEIATIFPPMGGNDRASRRQDGALSALRAAGRDVPEAWRLETPYEVGAAKAAVEALVASGRLPTAILCGNDVLAVGALHALRHRGIDVPGAITVTGIGDFNGSAEFEPGLTTVRIPARTIGSRAAAAMVRLTGGEAEPGARIPPELMVRGTCAPPRAG
ncbi:LacI family DNA-binding transcriptional regulator [Jannaschia seohaensis]|uniref:LacI family transcriptional regulator n=1 Tax=Jannaschia seohaensis TaxID=475081 RepID=A0A2Y9AYZ7_9RHOB|nr:LacI family DNA-binding transcriptional regulator [Jannaschia seohaensis]PWJ15811.1 LacI family transcriptional regulator [Jannaschia seohaensis]SSA49504.1 LacI family transcriptional regulator [Jannaschia seohaensis]